MRNETTKQPAEGAARSRHVALALLILVYTLNFLDRQILSILNEPIAADLHLSDTDLGLLGGFAFALFYSVLAIPAAWLADRFSRVWMRSGRCLSQHQIELVSVQLPRKARAQRSVERARFDTL